MAKLKAIETKTMTSKSYRIERRSTFAWRPIRTITYSDGSTVEEMAFKEDMIDIVMRKLGALMRDDGNAVFNSKAKNAV